MKNKRKGAKIKLLKRFSLLILIYLFSIFLAFILIGCSDIKNIEKINNININNKINNNKEIKKIKEIEVVNVETDIYKIISNKYKLDYKILKGITQRESDFNNLIINVNKNKNKLFQGSHKFVNKKLAINFANKIDKLKLNFDLGYNQINNNWKNVHFKKYDELFNINNNIEISAKILKYNLDKYCNNDINCRLSVYNTGYKKSEIGKKYRDKVIKYSKKY